MQINKVNIVVFIIFIVFFSFEGIAQTLATVGNDKISVQDFKTRFELTPKSNSKYEIDSIKIDFLYTMIAEKLWAFEGKKFGFQNNPFVQNSILDFEKKLLRDKLYKEKIENKIKISRKEKNSDLKKVHKKLILNFLFDKNEISINKLYDKLNAGANIDSLLLYRKEFAKQINGIPVVFGDMKKELEDKLYSLKPGMFTKPIRIDKGWTIYYLKKIEYIKSIAKYKGKTDEKIVHDVIFDRKASILYHKYFAKHISNKIVNVDKKLFSKLFSAIKSIFQQKGKKLFNKNNSKYSINYSAAMQIKNGFTEENLKSEFIKFKESPIALGQFIYDVAINGFNLPNTDSLVIRRKLSSRVKKFILDELLTREAVKSISVNSADIHKEVKMWEDSFIASYYRSTFLDSINVTNSEIRNFYLKVKSQIPDSIKSQHNIINDKIKSGIYFQKLNYYYKIKTAELAKKYGISINRRLLNSVKVSQIEMMVYRYLGFGGAITAVPYLQPFYEWKNLLSKKIKTNLN